jgi:hypothetical protein
MGTIKESYKKLKMGLLYLLLITAQILLLIIEAAVAIIQSCVIAILRTLYSREVD